MGCVWGGVWCVWGGGCVCVCYSCVTVVYGLALRVDFFFFFLTCESKIKSSPI